MYTHTPGFLPGSLSIAAYTLVFRDAMITLLQRCGANCLMHSEQTFFLKRTLI